MWRKCWLLLVAAPLLHAQSVCDTAKFQGAYGFLLTGETTISGDSKPVASAGRLVFDGNGAISGESSVNFAGYLLGNPVTGSYEVTPACTITWKLQDDSGAFQHFAGRFSTDWSHASFRQADAGGAQSGTLERIAPQCSPGALAATYQFTISGSTTPMNLGETAHMVHATGKLFHGEDGQLQLSVDGGGANRQEIDIDSSCVVTTSLSLPTGTASLRGYLVKNGEEILAIETDAGAAVTAKFTVLNAAR